jgi:hypothetical protein
VLGRRALVPILERVCRKRLETRKNHMDAASPPLSTSFPRRGQPISRIWLGAKASVPSRASSGFATPPSPPSTHENARQIRPNLRELTATAQLSPKLTHLKDADVGTDEIWEYVGKKDRPQVR